MASAPALAGYAGVRGAMDQPKDRNRRGWSAIIREPRVDKPGGDSPTLIDPALASEVRAALDDRASSESAHTLSEAVDDAPKAVGRRTIEERYSETARGGERAPAQRPNAAQRPNPAQRPKTGHPPSRAASAPPSPRPTTGSHSRGPTSGLRVPARDTTHIDLASALGVGPLPPSAPPPANDSSTPDPNAPLLASTPLPKVLENLKAPPARRRGPADHSPDAGELQRVIATTDSVSRMIPFVLVVFLLVATALVAGLLISGRPVQQKHVELRFLPLRGQAVAQIASKTPTRIALATEPQGLLVLHGHEILGKTPLSVDLPIRLSNPVGVELSGPYFERWIGEVKADEAGDYQVDVILKRRH